MFEKKRKVLEPRTIINVIFTIKKNKQTLTISFKIYIYITVKLTQITQLKCKLSHRIKTDFLTIYTRISHTQANNIKINFGSNVRGISKYFSSNIIKLARILHIYDEHLNFK